MNLHIKINIITIQAIDIQIPGLKLSSIDCFKGGMHATNAMNDIIKNTAEPTI